MNGDFVKSMKFLIVFAAVLSCFPTAWVQGMDGENEQASLDVLFAYLKNNKKLAKQLIEKHPESGRRLLDYIIEHTTDDPYRREDVWDKKIRWTRYLVENKLVDLNANNALLQACKNYSNVYCSTKYIELLLNLGASPNVNIPSTDRSEIFETPLIIWAVKNNYIEIAKLLINSPIFAFELNTYPDIPNTIRDDVAILFFIKKILPNAQNIDESMANVALNRFITNIISFTFQNQNDTEYGYWHTLCPFLNNTCFKLHTIPTLVDHPLEQLLNNATNTSKSKLYRDCLYLCLERVLDNPKHAPDVPAVNPFLPLSSNGCLLEQIIQKQDMRLFNFCVMNRNFKNLINYPLKHRADNATILHLCAQYNMPEAIKIICDMCEAKLIEMSDKQNKKALIYALEKGHTECVQELLNHRCNPGDETTIELARKYCSNVVPLLYQAQALSIENIPHDILQHIFAHTAHGCSLKNRIASLIKGPILTSTKWNHILYKPPLNLPDCAAVYASNLSAKEINKVLSRLMIDSDRDQDERIAMFNYLVSLNIQSINSSKYSLLDQTLQQFNIEWVKTIIHWYEEYDKQEFVHNPKHIPLINQPGCYIWNNNSCNYGIVHYNQGMPSLGFAFFVLKEAEEKPLHNTQLIFSALNCIRYLLEHGADPNISIPVHGAIQFKSPCPLVAVALDQGLKYAIPLLIKAGLDVNRIYHLNNNLDHTLLTRSARTKNTEAIEMLLKIDGIEINKAVNGMTALDFARQGVRNDTVLKLLAAAGAISALPSPATNNQAPTIQQPSVTAIGANTNNALLNNTELRIANTNPAPVPDNNPSTITTHWPHKKSLVWATCFAAGLVSTYGLYKYFWQSKQDVDEDDEEHDTADEELSTMAQEAFA